MKRLFFLMVLWLPVIVMAAETDEMVDARQYISTETEADTVLQSKDVMPGGAKVRIDPDILKTECPDAFARYHKGEQLKIAGWTLFGTGLALFTAGLTCKLGNYELARSSCPQGYNDYWTVSGNNTDISPGNDGDHPLRGTAAARQYQETANEIGAAGFLMLFAGVPALITSIPLLPVGYKYQKNAAIMYDDMCVNKRVSDATVSQNAFRLYSQAQQIKTSGWSLFGIGCAMFITGHAMMSLSGGLTSYASAVGYYMIWASVPVTLSSVVLLPVGYSLESKAKAMDANVGAKKKAAACSLNLQTSRDGIGIALRF